MVIVPWSIKSVLVVNLLNITKYMFPCFMRLYECVYPPTLYLYLVNTSTPFSRYIKFYFRLFCTLFLFSVYSFGDVQSCK